MLVIDVSPLKVNQKEIVSNKNSNLSVDLFYVHSWQIDLEWNVSMMRNIFFFFDSVVKTDINLDF